MLAVDILDFNSSGRSIITNGDESEAVANFNFNATQMGRGTFSIIYESLDLIDDPTIMADFEEFKEQISGYIKEIAFDEAGIS